MAKYQYFRCKSNPRAPLLKLLPWEARDMKTHPDYERVDECGEVIEVDDEMEGTFPIHSGGK